MRSIIEKYYLEIAVFVCGAVVMVLELIGSRFFAPHFGTTLYVWSSIIGVIMGSLSIGYWFGGRMSTMDPRQETFSLIIFTAALSVVGLSLAREQILALADTLTAATDIRWGSLFAAVALFTLPNVLLGMVSPYAARLKIDAVKSSGQAVGNLYAISTVGSIFGTFAAGFWMIGLFSGEQISIWLAVILAAISLLVDGRNYSLLKALLLVLVLVWGVAGMRTKKEGLPLTIDTSYARYKIEDIEIDQNETVRALITGNRGAQSLMYIINGKASDELVVPYNRYFLMGRHFNSTIENGLLIGGGSFAFARGFLNAYPDASIDVVEIDPELKRISKDYFNFRDDARLTVYNEDGRVFLNRNEKKYDCIYIDAFNFLETPFQMATRDAVLKVNNSLNDGGCVFVNVVSPAEGQGSKILRSMLGTYKSVFPQVYVFATDPKAAPDKVSNYVLLALKSETAPQWSDDNREFDSYLKTRMDQSIKDDLPVLTDEYAPLEKYALEFLK